MLLSSSNSPEGEGTYPGLHSEKQSWNWNQVFYLPARWGHFGALSCRTLMQPSWLYAQVWAENAPFLEWFFFCNVLYCWLSSSVPSIYSPSIYWPLPCSWPCTTCWGIRDYNIAPQHLCTLVGKQVCSLIRSVNIFFLKIFRWYKIHPFKEYMWFWT